MEIFALFPLDCSTQLYSGLSASTPPVFYGSGRHPLDTKPALLASVPRYIPCSTMAIRFTIVIRDRSVIFT